MRVYASTATLLASVASAAVLGAIVGATLGLRYSNRRSHRSHRKRTMPKRLILVRHGESQGNIDPSLYTRVPDNALHLTELGYEQAVAAGRSIKQILGDETVRFIVSPYMRTIETFQGITRAWGSAAGAIPWSEEPRIREQDFGNFQDPQKIRECKMQRRRFGSFFYRFPSGESPADVYDRISSFLESLHRLFTKTSEQNYVLVTHGVAIRVILTRYFKYRICEFEQLQNFHNAEFAVLEFDERTGRFDLRKTVTNHIHVRQDGKVDVRAEEFSGLRVYDAPDDMLVCAEASAKSLCSPLPLPSSPVNHFCHAIAPPPPPSLSERSVSSSSTSSSPRGDSPNCFGLHKKFGSREQLDLTA